MLRRDKSGPREPYFLDVQQALREAGISQPALVLDEGRLRQNIRQLKGDLPDGMKLRLVAKSLPVPELLKLVSTELGTHRYMTFNLTMLKEVTELDPTADQLLGKPLPVTRAADYYSRTPTNETTGEIYWLIDTESRLQEYAEFALSKNLTLNIVLELDVGLHRGGFEVDGQLAQALETIKTDISLKFCGFMGYEAHIAKAPTLLGMRQKALNKAVSIYARALEMAEQVLGVKASDLPIRNAAGSPTFRLYDSTEIANEVSVGSVLVKPSDFETDLLENYAPALFIAAPAIKVGGRMKTPVLEAFDPLKRLLNPNLDRSIFLHGGNWKAYPVDPPGLAYNPIYGRSSNQEMLNGGPKTAILPDEFVFLRPSQSEAVLLQFGDIAVYKDGAIVDTWSPFSPSV
ncbi:hypothetical protein GCM10007094_17950 [Pseudovibrio japonicus]|uniref:Alanine racemase N-terminal domain-containing protein n=1 Tax=Pseudovibrio japonicus TaxID=366534 RepID=A0ABQ3E8S6_9HYPH|nr:alanine racemase [Pseudovibrio japonicus]GHB29973.1 hypothetical protein GCM10007094_17950 [Pseudovibrio japonicus]